MMTALLVLETDRARRHRHGRPGGRLRARRLRGGLDARAAGGGAHHGRGSPRTALLLGSANDAAEALAIDVSRERRRVRAGDERAGAASSACADAVPLAARSGRPRPLDAARPRCALVRARHASTPRSGDLAHAVRRRSRRRAGARGGSRTATRCCGCIRARSGRRPGSRRPPAPASSRPPRAEGRELVAIVLGGRDEAFSDAAALLDHGFAAFERADARRGGAPLRRASRVRGGTVPVVAGERLGGARPGARSAEVASGPRRRPDGGLPSGQRARGRDRSSSLVAGRRSGEVPLVVGRRCRRRRARRALVGRPRASPARRGRSIAGPIGSALAPAERRAPPASAGADARLDPMTERRERPVRARGRPPPGGGARPHDRRGLRGARARARSRSSRAARCSSRTCAARSTSRSRRISWRSAATATPRSRSGASRSSSTSRSTSTGRDVILVEDIVDTGLTSRYLLSVLRSRAARLARGLHAPRKVGPPDRAATPRYVGFDCPDRFVVGYGLDFERALPQPADILRGRGHGGPQGRPRRPRSRISAVAGLSGEVARSRDPRYAGCTHDRDGARPASGSSCRPTSPSCCCASAAASGTCRSGSAPPRRPRSPCRCRGSYAAADDPRPDEEHPRGPLRRGAADRRDRAPRVHLLRDDRAAAERRPLRDLLAALRRDRAGRADGGADLRERGGPRRGRRS